MKISSTNKKIETTVDNIIEEIKTKYDLEITHTTYQDFTKITMISLYNNKTHSAYSLWCFFMLRNADCFALDNTTDKISADIEKIANKHIKKLSMNDIMRGDEQR